MKNANHLRIRRDSGSSFRLSKQLKILLVYLTHERPRAKSIGNLTCKTRYVAKSYCSLSLFLSFFSLSLFICSSRVCWRVSIETRRPSRRETYGYWWEPSRAESKSGTDSIKMEAWNSSRISPRLAITFLSSGASFSSSIRRHR